MREREREAERVCVKFWSVSNLHPMCVYETLCFVFETVCV